MISAFGVALLALLNIAWWIVLAHIIIGWLVNFQVLNLQQPIVAQVYFGLNRLLEPLYGPIRRVLPNTGGLDFSPLVVIIAIIFLQQLAVQMANA
ncbi:YggT family protein [Amylibacter sp. IMCC11727]|uniref:YggT family protein n=1 Tax=Amylibacter sp. IMCC11727 TaxID=3039851 RepID=UPI00244E5278|nr:YggT family protein [Amylibacter sp. IMCC11727]WGI21938.1 YggT family protein [Amylibacter sp. IMCC11727]